MTVSVIVFTLDEIDGIKVILPQIKKEWYDQLLIVDGNSTDGTIEYYKEHNYDYFIQKEKGSNAAFKEAMQRITGDIVIMFAPDGNSLPEMIPQLSDQIINHGYDIAIASRYLKDAKSYDDDIVTSFGNWMFTTLFNVLFRTKYTDVLGMYRAYKRDWLMSHLDNTKSMSWGTCFLARSKRENLKVIEIPGDEPKRIGGQRKMRPLINGYHELRTIITEAFKK
jgi:glycosyltransferase involved in cell wall biosynthesis